ncbi:uncharacterized protein N7446_000540 [Penicillium canescens]|uniref:Uncharacterized protein n=1 Tax=Penicillium canescens TaxID=5083 RepID=A0AAD6I404_PENCN|nr:uncharacterized protein N7446_000540 [Penicillium canescens]KAJ6030398.1 hypothetical protein N7460_010664 [Penicillium canescens]KAJ6060772.1 hypothetical protein N7444_002626 [Penicillium canescens]KAJ6077604.1 hypothetical protein N7446_000540 [Penicillium canescens]
MQVQITLFTCGGYAVGVKLAHCPADAQALMAVTHIRSINSQKSFGVQLKSMAQPVFDPELLDSCAGGDIDSPDLSFTLLPFTGTELAKLKALALADGSHKQRMHM